MSQFAPLYLVAAVLLVGVVFGLISRFTPSLEDLLAKEEAPGSQPFTYYNIHSGESTTIWAASEEEAHARHWQILDRGLGDDSQYPDDIQ